MITYLEGTVFNAPAKTYVNTVNCFGVMGAGIALEFKLRYPKMFEDYYIKCKEKKVAIGNLRIYEESTDIWIMNFPTKNHWRYPSKIEWIEVGLKYFVGNYKNWNIKSIAFPKLGTHNGGLEWQEVKLLMEKYLANLEIEVYICLDEKCEAEGIEEQMLNTLNECSRESLVKEINISKEQAQKIIQNIPYSRFWHVANVDEITKKTYEKVFTYFYALNGYKNINKGKQISLFD